MVPKICAVDGCGIEETRRLRRGMCRSHYDRWLRRTPQSDRMWPTTEERFWSKVDKSGECWRWTSAKMTDGYGSFRLDGKGEGAHRLSWEWANGPIPPGMFIDHMCHNRACVNPAHLQIATNKLNMENLSGAQKRNTSGVRGVHKRPNGKWHASVKHNWTTYSLGTFETIEEAEVVVVAKRNELYTNNLVDRQGKRSAYQLRAALTK
jgi:hypothetical protein